MKKNSPTLAESIQQALAQVAGPTNPGNPDDSGWNLNQRKNIVCTVKRSNTKIKNWLTYSSTVWKRPLLKEVTSGPNVSVLEPYDEGVFYGLQEIDGTNVVSDIQLYLDLKNYKGRGEEAAEFLYEQRLRKLW